MEKVKLLGDEVYEDDEPDDGLDNAEVFADDKVVMWRDVIHCHVTQSGAVT
jgi:hypothetical protein